MSKRERMQVALNMASGAVYAIRYADGKIERLSMDSWRNCRFAYGEGGVLLSSVPLSMATA